jgi:hypothetical protein
VRHAVLGNGGAFAFGAEDAPCLVGEFVEQFEEIGLMQLLSYSVYVWLVIGGAPSRPFSAITLLR